MKKSISIIIAVLFLFSCGGNKAKNEGEEIAKKNTVRDVIPNAVIYEVNIRQHTPEGTFKAFTEKHLDRIADMGVDILWIMPIFPISEKNRKGELGSYYAVADYKGINPEFGTLEEFKQMVSRAHEKGMFVILDWVPNHTGWDNKWINEHPDWFTKNEEGDIIPPMEDWADVADLNYDNKEMRAAMIDALQFWIKEADVDGYRCDVAWGVPVDFWDEARVALDSVKPVFMLAEADGPELADKAFDMVYGWDFHHMMNDVAQGKANAGAVVAQIDSINAKYDSDDIVMQFITNHDENSWNGTVGERMGDARECMAVLTYIVPGMPLIYSGQEANLDKRLRFFTKDTIAWSDTSQYSFYRALSKLKDNPALSSYGKIEDKDMLLTANDNVLIICRHANADNVVAVFNLSDKPQQIELSVLKEVLVGSYKDFFTEAIVDAGTEAITKLTPWEYKVLIKVE